MASTLNLRVRVFVPVFAIACIASLAYVFARPAVYSSDARLQFEGAASRRQSDEASASPMLDAAEALTSGAVLESVARALGAGQAGAAVSRATLQHMVSAVPVPGTSVIELRAEGGDRELLPRILTTWIETYRRTFRESHDLDTTAAMDQARLAVQELGLRLTDKRAEMEAFRRKFDIVSVQREENQAMAQLKSLNSALSEARNREVNAEARLSAIRDSMAAGKAAERPSDRSAVANLEKRLSDLRERMKDLEHDYTAQYLASDPRYKALRANEGRLEQEIEIERQGHAQRTLDAAEAELTSARQAALRLEQQLGGLKRDAQNFTSRFAEHAALANELRQLEESYNSGKERLSQLEMQTRVAVPKVTVLSPPSIPGPALRPDYGRDALLGVAGSACLGFGAVWFVEFFKRSGVPQPIPVTQPLIQIAYAPNGMPGTLVPALGAPALRLPETVARPPRELSAVEIEALWAAAVPNARLLIAALLSGLSVEEFTALRCESVGLDSVLVQASDGTLRSCLLQQPLKRLLEERQQARGDGQSFVATGDGALSVADAEGLIACAAVDAGLAHPVEIDAAALRHTYIAFLIRQGARLGDIGEVIGRVAPAALREYARLSPPGPGRALEQIDTVFPVPAA